MNPRLHLARPAAVVALTAALAVAGTGVAQAVPRDACQDLRNQQRVHESLAQGYWDLAQLMQSLGSQPLYETYRDLYHAETSAASNVDRNLNRLGCG